MMDQYMRMDWARELELFKRSHPGPTRLRFVTNLGGPHAEQFGFDRQRPPRDGDIRDVATPETALALIRRGWATEVEPEANVEGPRARTTTRKP